MKRENVNYLVVGVVVLVVLALSFVALLRITGGTSASDHYHVHYRNVSGIIYGTPVMYEGYRIGEVVAVSPDRGPDGTRYRIDLRVQRDWHIPDDSRAQLLASGLLADVIIGIREGESAIMLEPGSEITSRESADMFVAIQELAGEATHLTRNNLVPMIEMLGERLDSITGKIDSGAAPLLSDAQTLLQQLNSGAASLDQLLGPENRQHVASMLQDVAATAAHSRQLAADLQLSREQIDTLLAELNTLASDARPAVTEAAEDLRDTLAAISHRVDSISHHIDAASRNFNEFSREIRRNPGRLLFAPPADPDEAEQ